MKIKTDCKTETGITVGLIDGIINSFRLLNGRDFKPKAVKEAMKDFYHDKDYTKFQIQCIKTLKIKIEL